MPVISNRMIQNWIINAKHSVVLISVSVEGVKAMVISYQALNTLSGRSRLRYGP